MYFIILSEDIILDRDIRINSPGILPPETILMSKSILNNEQLKIDLKIEEDYEYGDTISVVKDSILVKNSLLVIESLDGFSNYQEINNITYDEIASLFIYARNIKNSNITIMEYQKTISLKRDLFTYTEFIENSTLLLIESVEIYDNVNRLFSDLKNPNIHQEILLIYNINYVKENKNIDKIVKKINTIYTQMLEMEKKYKDRLNLSNRLGSPERVPSPSLDQEDISPVSPIPTIEHEKIINDNLNLHIEDMHQNISKIPDLLQKLRERYQYKVNVEKSIVSMTYLQKNDDIDGYKDSLVKNDNIIESIYFEIRDLLNL